MPLSERQRTVFAGEQAGRIPFDTSPATSTGPEDSRHVFHGSVAAGWSATSDLLSAGIALHGHDRRHHVQLAPQ
ncbi:hypothetical protein ACIRJL_10295 [Streptomyces sp. NPDC102383]|uniref:hypothetical protein n=1 Tax=Streptomyces sp. NPDC102383 TaxID=3366165 RepID=UPI0037F55F47